MTDIVSLLLGPAAVLTQGLVGMIVGLGLYALEVLLVVNHAPPETLLNPSEGNKISQETVSKLNLSITALIPCYCDLMTSRGRELIVVHEDPEHDFSKIIGTLADRLLRKREDHEVKVEKNKEKSMGNFQGAPA